MLITSDTHPLRTWNWTIWLTALIDAEKLLVSAGMTCDTRLVALGQCLERCATWDADGLNGVVCRIDSLITSSERDLLWFAATEIDPPGNVRLRRASQIEFDVSDCYGETPEAGDCLVAGRMRVPACQ